MIFIVLFLLFKNRIHIEIFSNKHLEIIYKINCMIYYIIHSIQMNSGLKYIGSTHFYLGIDKH